MIKVLIADDHKMVREGLAELLAGERSVTVVGTASDGAEALSKVNALKPDLLILDISMQILDGFEVLRHLRQQGLHVKILMLSMHKDSTSIRKALDLGADGYVLKEEAFDTLTTAIAEVMRGNRYFSTPTAIALGSLERETVDVLTPREREIVGLIAAGQTTKEVAAILGISAKTVETHRHRVMEKLGCHKVTDLVRYALKRGLV
jgi:DNA-binding NarL/FixJ family response regulator